MSNLIIGIAGTAGSGKDTMADYFGCPKVSFATPLKEMLNGLFGWNNALWSNRKWKETPQEALYGKSPRQLAQTLGTEWGRNCISPTFWTDAGIRLARSAGKVVVMPDVRFEEEAKAVDVLIIVERAGVSPVSEHASENVLPLYKYAHHIVKNNGSIEQFWEESQNLYRRIVDGRA